MDFMDLPDKTHEALSTFTAIAECTYTSKATGSSGQSESMTCDCVENWDPETKTNQACSEESNCINRVTSVECVDGVCTCGDNCQNQRFQRKQYAKVSVIQTEKKGYGLRADAPIPEGGFVYEYIGEVINENTFRARMADYDARKFKHFYFMMLKNDSFIDATLKGSLARFCNHSCNPNAYVDKWVVGDKLRMGIFAKRSIKQGEEITFDYNVDRYGAQSQPCYCGEPNCIKFMGGKTQTDAALLLPDGIAEALGVTPKQERAWLKENKHLRKQNEEAVVNEQFVKSLEVSELEQADVSKVMGALMKSQDVHVVQKLVERIYITANNDVNLLIVRMHGYKTLSSVLSSFSDDVDMVRKILKVLGKWPTMTRNKISSSQIENVVKTIGESADEETKDLCVRLLEQWGKLQMAYRIPKTKGEGIKGYSRSRDDEEISRSNSPEKDDPLPEGWEVAYDANSKSIYYFHRGLNVSRWDKPTAVPTGPKVRKHDDKEDRRDRKQAAREEEERLRALREEHFSKIQQRERELQELINGEKSRMEEKRQEEERRREEKRKESKERREKRSGDGIENGKAREKKDKVKKDRSERKSKGEDKKGHDESKWTRLFAAHVPNIIKKYEKEIGRENLKGCARDFVHALVEKEKNKGSVPPEELDNHKLKKVKVFCNDSMEKFLVKYRAKKERKREERREERKGDRKRVKTAVSEA